MRVVKRAAGDIDELNRGLGHFFGMPKLGEIFEPFVGHADDAGVRLGRSVRIDGDSRDGRKDR